MKRRKYLAAAAAILGTSAAGCTGENIPSMTQEEALDKFSDVQQFESPSDNYADAIRFVDRDAGVVIYAVHGRRANAGAGLTAIPLDQTTLDDNTQA